MTELGEYGVTIEVWLVAAADADVTAMAMQIVERIKADAFVQDATVAGVLGPVGSGL